MKKAETQTFRESELLSTISSGLLAKASELGLCMTTWNQAGNMACEPRLSSEFCEMICKTGRGCEKSCQSLAKYVLDNDDSSRATSPIGCCQFALPIHDRHRTTGAVVLSYPTREMLDEEHLARVCDRLQLDRQVMVSYARHACRHSASEASHFQNIFSQLLGEKRSANKATEAIDSLSTNLAGTYEALSMLYRISGSMTVSQEPQVFLQDICDQLLNVMNTSVASAVVYDERTKLGEDIIVKSARDSAISSQQLRMLTATYLIPRLPNEESFLLENNSCDHDNSTFGRNLQNLLAVPLIIDRKKIGVLLVLNKQGSDFDSFDAKFISSIASQASVFLTNNRMYAELQELLMGVLYSLTETIDAKDPYTCGHSRRVAAISRKLAEELGFDSARVKNINLAGLLHDIGKIGVPEAILCKAGKLTDEEYENIKRHPAVGAKILHRIHHFEPVIAGVLSHHERPDGRGYPHGQAGADIPIEGLILGLADSWDAMTSSRTYRKALSMEKAKSEISRCAGTQFDPKLAELFLSWDLDVFMKELHSDDIKDSQLLNSDGFF